MYRTRPAVERFEGPNKKRVTEFQVSQALNLRKVICRHIHLDKLNYTFLFSEVPRVSPCFDVNHASCKAKVAFVDIFQIYQINPKSSCLPLPLFPAILEVKNH